MEPEGSLRHLQVHDTCPYPEPAQSSPSEKYSSQEKVSEIQMWQCSVLKKTHDLCVPEARYL